MAENKKSFIAYADWVSVFNMLTDEEAGKLVKLIFSYAKITFLNKLFRKSRQFKLVFSLEILKRSKLNMVNYV